MPGYCPVCGKSLRSEFYSETYSRSANYTNCIICKKEYCVKCAPYLLCPTDFSRFSTEHQEYIKKYYRKISILYKIALISAFFGFPILLGIEIILLRNSYLTVFLLLLCFIVPIFIVMVPGRLYKKKVFTLYSQLTQENETSE